MSDPLPAASAHPDDDDDDDGDGGAQRCVSLAAAVQLALHCASLRLSAAPARQPMAQEGRWHAEVAPTQQCPAVAHLASQAGSSAEPTVAMSNRTNSQRNCRIFAVLKTEIKKIS